MANCTDFKSGIAELLKEANESHHNSLEIIVESKKYLTKMYDDLFSAYDNLNRQTNENVVVMEKILKSGENPSDTSTVLEALKSSLNLPSHKFLEEMMIAKQKQLTEAQQVLKLFLNGKSEEILKARCLLQNISPLPEVQESNQPVPAIIDTKSIYNGKYEPKFGSSGALSDEQKNSAVIITHVVHPGHLYIQLVDQDFPLYQKMQEDLQLEFFSATNQSSSYCPTPTAGKAYALQLGQIWYRVLVEKLKMSTAFFVDTGERIDIQPIMKFHFLPSRFMKLKAQAVKCSLFGVASLNFSKVHNHFQYSEGGSESKLCRYVGAHAVAIFSEVKAGSVGMARSSGYLQGEPVTKEQFAFVTLFVNGQSESVNTLAVRTHHEARFVSALKIELSELQEIRRKVQLAAEHWSSLVNKKLHVKTEQISKVSIDDDYPNEQKQEEEVNLPVEKRFKPKYGHLEVKSRCIQCATVLITCVIHPNHFYVEIEDQDVPLYHQMKKDLQQEFCEATNQSPSYCSSPLLGQSYAVKSGGIWHRAVIVEIHSFVNRMVFFVDTGLCQPINPSMTFHVLPESFMELKAQAVRCSLYGITAPRRENEDFEVGLYPKSAEDMLRKYVGTRAVAIIKDLKAGKVGSAKEADGIKELTALVILYANGAAESINREICQSGLARLMKNIEIDVPEHQEIRRKALLEAGRWVLPEAELTLSSFTIQEDKVELQTDEDSGMVLLPDGTDDDLQKNIGPAKPLVKEKDDDIVLPVTFIGAQSPEALFFRTPELEDNFIKMQNTLYTYFNVKHREPVSIDDESVSCDVGSICAIKSNDRWYRAEIVDNEKHPDILVSLMDKDLFIMAQAGDIRRLPEELELMPRTVLCCSLSGIYPSGSSKWDSKVTRYIIERLKEAEKLTIRFRKNPDDNTAGSTFPAVTDGLLSTSLNTELVSLGLAMTSSITKSSPTLLKMD